MKKQSGYILALLLMLVGAAVLVSGQAYPLMMTVDSEGGGSGQVQSGDVVTVSNWKVSFLVTFDYSVTVAWVDVYRSCIVSLTDYEGYPHGGVSTYGHVLEKKFTVTGNRLQVTLDLSKVGMIYGVGVSARNWDITTWNNDFRITIALQDGNLWAGKTMVLKVTVAPSAANMQPITDHDSPEIVFAAPASTSQPIDFDNPPLPSSPDAPASLSTTNPVDTATLANVSNVAEIARPKGIIQTGVGIGLIIIGVVVAVVVAKKKP